MESIMNEMGIWGCLAASVMALAFVGLWVICASAKLLEDEDERLVERGCHTCAHCSEAGFSACCSECVDTYPANVNWSRQKD